MTDKSLEIVQGTLEMLVLKTLSQGEPMHGFAIGEWIRNTTSDVLDVEEGSLYPALYRMQRRGWITASWGTSEKNRRAKFYRMTVQGKKQLVRAERDWSRYVKVVGDLLSAAEQNA